MFITGDNDTGYKLFTGVNDTGDKFIRSFWVSMDASFYGGSNDTIGSRVRPWRPEILLSYCQHCLFTVVVDTGEQFFGGVIDTGDKSAPRCR